MSIVGEGNQLLNTHTHTHTPVQKHEYHELREEKWVEYENVKTFKYLSSLLTNQNSIVDEIKCRLKAGNFGYYSVQTLLSSRLL